MILDLSDPLVRAMVDRNHTPEEMWTMGGELSSVSCSLCYQVWPCPSRQALREYLRQRSETRRKKLNA